MFPRKRRGLISQGPAADPAPPDTNNPEDAPANPPPPSTPPKKAQEDGLYSNGKWYCTSSTPTGVRLTPDLGSAPHKAKLTPRPGAPKAPGLREQATASPAPAPSSWSSRRTAPARAVASTRAASTTRTMTATSSSGPRRPTSARPPRGTPVPPLRRRRDGGTRVYANSLWRGSRVRSRWDRRHLAGGGA